jgi:hypothetical protein
MKNRMAKRSLTIPLLVVGLSCLTLGFNCSVNIPTRTDAGFTKDLFLQSTEVLTDVLVHDIFSPPVAARNYTYPLIAAYEVARCSAPHKYPSLAGQLNGLSPLQDSLDREHVDYPLASLLAFVEVAKHLVFSEDKLEKFKDEINVKLGVQSFSEIRRKETENFASTVALHIINWADLDNYKQTRSYPKFSIDDDIWTWKPTPPAYMEGIEPHWNLIRPMALDSASQFRPAAPTPFSLEKNSAFFKELVEVYEAVKNITTEQFEIAHFWDCNPYKMNITGHVMHATKKITPGGHWVNIAVIAARNSNRDWVESIASVTLVALSISDGFISCWDEKYRSRLIRPESLINEYIDENWAPILQTPPFPEHTSGHSVVSNIASTILTELYGPDFSFEDDTEVPYGLPVRSFQSFEEAAKEATISRLYGGIHYRPAIEGGKVQGEKIALWILDKIDMGSLRIAKQ